MNMQHDKEINKQDCYYDSFWPNSKAKVNDDFSDLIAIILHLTLPSLLKHKHNMLTVGG